MEITKEEKLGFLENELEKQYQVLVLAKQLNNNDFKEDIMERARKKIKVIASIIGGII